MGEFRYVRDWSGTVTTFTYDPEGRLMSVEAPTPPGTSCEHDEAKRVFRITSPDGKVTEFHDRAALPGRRGGPPDGRAFPRPLLRRAQDHVSLPREGALSSGDRRRHGTRVVQQHQTGQNFL